MPYTVAQAAKELGASAARVYQLIEDGRLRAGRFGRAYTISEAALAACKRIERRRTGRPVTTGAGLRKSVDMVR